MIPLNVTEFSLSATIWLTSISRSAMSGAPSASKSVRCGVIASMEIADTSSFPARDGNEAGADNYDDDAEDEFADQCRGFADDFMTK